MLARSRFAYILSGLLILTGLAAGCTSESQQRPVAMAMSSLSVSADADGLSQLLRRLPSMTVDEQLLQLRGFVESNAAADLKSKASYVLGRVLLKNTAAANSASQASLEGLREAVGRFDEASRIPPLFERSQLHISEAAIALGSEKTVREALEQIMQKTQIPEHKTAAEYALAQSYMRGSESDKAASHFAHIKESAPQSQYALGSTYYLANMDLAAGKTDEALQAYRSYLRSSPDGRFATEVITQMKALPGFQPTVEDRNLFARVHYQNNQWAQALQEWSQAGNTSEWYKRAIAMRRVGRSEDAKKALYEGLQNYPTSESVVPAATVLAKMLSRANAYAMWHSIYQRSPNAADVALYNMAIRSSGPQALSFYNQVITRYPTSAYAPESAWWVVWNQIQAGNSQAAIAQLQSASTHYPDARAASRFSYWLGKMYERTGQKDKAKLAYQHTITEYPWHYYAHRSQARLNVLAGKSDRGWKTFPGRVLAANDDDVESWDWPEPPAELAAQHSPTLETLTELRQWDECIEILPKDAGLLRAFYLAKLNQPMEAINTAGKALRGKPQPTEPWMLSFPLVYGKIIARESKIKGLDPLLVQALIREESRYHVGALSSSNAIGLMQLMPGTAAGVAKRLGIKLSGNADIHKPENNLKMGVDYLSYVLHRFNGNALFAVASYNGGPNAVQRWAARMPSDTDVFVENIAFTETRDYVRKVFGSYWNYESVYPR